VNGLEGGSSQGFVERVQTEGGCAYWREWKGGWKQIGRWGNYETDDMKLEVKMSLRKGREGSEASAHRLSLGLVRKAPRASLRTEVVSGSERTDCSLDRIPGHHNRDVNELGFCRTVKGSFYCNL